MMNTEAQLLWKRHKAQEEYGRRRESNRTEGILFYPMYHMFFHLYLRWVLAWIPYGPARFPEPISEDIPFNDPEYQVLLLHFKRAPVELHGVGAFLGVLLGEQFEAIFGCKAAVEDYGYVADTLREEIKKLNPIPDTVVRAFDWLSEQIEVLRQASHVQPDSTKASSPNNSARDAEPATENQATYTGDDVNLSHRQIALLYIYQRKHLHPDEAQRAAQENGWLAPTSGRSVRQDYKKFSIDSNRQNVDKQALPKMIADITRIIPHLNGSARLWAEGELASLKDRQ